MAVREIIMDNTLSSLVAILKDRLQDQSYSDSSLKTFLNQAQNEILGEDKYPFMQRIDEYTDIQSGAISLPIGYAGSIALYAEHKDGNRLPLRFVSPEQYFENTEALNRVWTTFANNIYFHISPKSDVPEDNKYKITHLYIANPMPMVEDDDRSAIPPQYVEALILSALSRAEQQRDNFDYAQIYANKADAILTNMKFRYGPGNLSADSTSTLPFRMDGGR